MFSFKQGQVMAASALLEAMSWKLADHLAGQDSSYVWPPLMVPLGV